MKIALILIAAFLALGAGEASAKSCRDANGHFLKCPAATNAAALAATEAPALTATELKAKPKKLSKADAKKELAAVQTTPAAPASPATLSAPAKKKGLLSGLLHPGPGKPAGPASPSTPGAPASPAQAATTTPAGHPHCSKGKPCGHSCIAMNKVCHKS